MIFSTTFVTLLASVSALRSPSETVGISETKRAFGWFDKKGPKPITNIPSGPSQQSLVKPFISKVDINQAETFLKALAAFPERYYKSENGIKSAAWISSQIQALIPKVSASSGVTLTVKNFDHSWKRQPSVIARLASKASTAKDVVIIGSHIDTMGQGSGKPEPNLNPAADDCASGTTVVFETLRILVENNFVPNRAIEFHFYSGEEEGIYGSNEIAEAYAKAQVNVVTYLNLDQSGYVKPGTSPQIGIFTDYIDDSATQFLRQIVESYTTTPQVDSTCGYRVSFDFHNLQSLTFG